MSAVCLAQDDGSTDKPAPSRLTSATSFAMGRVKDVANKGAGAVTRGADQITVKVEKIAHPEPHQPFQSNIVKSAVRGVGRYSGNVTVEAGRAVATTIGAGKNFVKKTASATRETMKQATHRLYHRRPRGPNDNTPASGDANGSPGLEPNELHKTDAAASR